MKQRRANIALLLLAVYLPLWLLASFHTHEHHGACNGMACEQQTSDLDGDNCLLCQFQQLSYEEAPQLNATVFLKGMEVEAVPAEPATMSVSIPSFSSRAPPVLL